MNKKIVIAFGGNAIIKKGQDGTFEEQVQNTYKSLDGVINLIKNDYQIVITHGNGPQVGALLLMVDAAKDKVPTLPMHALNAATEGTMGYIIEQSLKNVLHKNNLSKEIAVILSQVVVSKDDPSFNEPTKPVGKFYSSNEAENLSKTKSWCMKEDAGRGYRRVVPSPIPIDVIPVNSIKTLLEAGVLVIAVGGGGIPVILENGKLQGVDAVIDKDFASSLLANEINADRLIICTGEDYVKLNFNKANEKILKDITISEAQKFFDEDHFPAGSMGPKILAAIKFIENGGKEVIITSLENLEKAIEEKFGTRISKN